MLCYDDGYSDNTKRKSNLNKRSHIMLRQDKAKLIHKKVVITLYKTE